MCCEACFGASAVAFEIWLGFESVVDRFDDVAERAEKPPSGWAVSVLVGRSPPILDQQVIDRHVR